jgi:WD40 repeat protein
MTLEGHTTMVRCVLQLTDGRLVSGHTDNTIKVWNILSGSCLITLKGHTGWILCVIQLADSRLVSASADKTLKVWDTISGKCVMTLEGHTYLVYCVTQLTDGRLVSGSLDTTIKIWNIMSLSQQKWIRRRLLVLLFEASKILTSETLTQFDRHIIHPGQYIRRRQDLELLLRCSLNLSNNLINVKAFDITLKMLSMPEIVIRIAEYL